MSSLVGFGNKVIDSKGEVTSGGVLEISVCALACMYSIMQKRRRSFFIRFVLVANAHSVICYKCNGK